MKFLSLLLFISGTALAAYSPQTIVTDPAGVNQAAVKAASTAAGATDPALVVAISPNNTIPMSVASLPLPTGGSTSALQTTGNTSLASILAALPASLGQKAMANSLACTLASDQSSIPVTGTFWQTTQPVSGTFWQTTQPVSGTVTVNALTNSSVVKAQLQDNAGTAITVGQKTMSSSLPVTIASDQVAPKTYVNSAGSFVLNASLTTVTTASAPAGAVGFILEAKDANTANLRWAVGATATTTSGMQLQPGRDTGFVPVGADISLVAESGTLEYQLTWIKQ